MSVNFRVHVPVLYQVELYVVYTGTGTVRLTITTYIYCSEYHDRCGKPLCQPRACQGDQ